MKKYVCLLIVGIMLSVLTGRITAWALGESAKTVVYTMTHRTEAGNVTMYVAYNIAAQTEAGYWLQRVVRMQPDAAPLSITQTLLDSSTHTAIRYIMHRPAKMDRPENVIDLPLDRMGQDEMLPTPPNSEASTPTPIEVPAGRFDAQQGHIKNADLWLNSVIPVLGIVKAETTEWTMELFQIEDNSVDLLLKKPEKGGIVYLQ